MLSSEGSLLAALIVFAKSMACVLKWVWGVACKRSGGTVSGSLGEEGADLATLRRLVFRAGSWGF